MNRNQPIYSNAQGHLTTEAESTMLDHGFPSANSTKVNSDVLHRSDVIEEKDMNSHRYDGLLKETAVNEAPSEKWVYTDELQLSILEKDRKKSRLNLSREQEDHRCTVIANHVRFILKRSLCLASRHSNERRF